MKYILITGGVISGLGKGVSSSSLAHLLQLRGFEVTMIKIDPYLNIDAGTMSPYEHGECYVLNDGSEVDLDFGTYERFLDISLTGAHSITTGKVYKSVLEKERRGDYLGKTVQVVPHATNEVIAQIEKASKIKVRKGKRKPDVCLIELGGTVGDIESALFLEALRQLRAKRKSDFCHIHVSLVPVIHKELKSKPTQHSFKELRFSGLSPDFIFCRCSGPINDVIRRKVSMFCMVDRENIISVHDVDDIHKVPALLERQRVPDKVCLRLNLWQLPTEKWSPSIFESIGECKEDINIAIVCKYAYQDAYLSLSKALFHACMDAGRRLNIIWVDSESEKANFTCTADAIIVPGGFGSRGIQGKIVACQYAREQGIPFLGICFGFQLAVIEYARNVKGFTDASSEEFTGNRGDLIVEESSHKNLGGTMLKGLTCLDLTNGTKLRELYKTPTINERCRHRYEVSYQQGKELEDEDFKWTATLPIQATASKTAFRYEAFELCKHPFYVGVQYHPEFLSRYGAPSPVFSGLVKAGINIRKTAVIN
jgi:CTP synthase